MSVNRDYVDAIYRQRRHYEDGLQAVRESNCCANCDETDIVILTTSTVAGGIIGGVATGGPGVLIGAPIGFGVGLAICAVKKSIQEGRC